MKILSKGFDTLGWSQWMLV